MIFNDNVLDFISENYYVKDFFDSQFLKSLRDVFVKEMGIDKRVLGFKRVKGALMSSADFSYDFDKKVIEYCVFSIRKSCKLFSKENGIDFIDNFYFYMWQSILYEFLHVYQVVMREEQKGNDSVLIQTLRHSDAVCNGDISLRENYKMPYLIRKVLVMRIYNKYYDYFPEERHAQTISFDTMIKLYSSVFSDKTKELLAFKNLFAEEMFIGYEDIEENLCSLRIFYRYLRREDIFQNFDFSSYNSHERYLYGMLLTSEELIDEEKKLGIRK